MEGGVGRGKAYKKRRDLVEDVDYLPRLSGGGLFVRFCFLVWHIFVVWLDE